MLTVEQIKAELSLLSSKDRAKLQQILTEIESSQQKDNNKSVVSKELQLILEKCTSNRSEVFVVLVVEVLPSSATVEEMADKDIFARIATKLLVIPMGLSSIIVDYLLTN